MLPILNSLSSCCDVEMSPKRFCRTALCGVLSALWLTVTFCTIHWHTFVQVSLGGVRAFSDGPFSASISPGSTLFVVQKVRV